MNYLNLLDKQLFQLKWLLEKDHKKVNFYYSIFFNDSENLFFNIDKLKESKEKFNYDEILISNILSKTNDLFDVWDNHISNKLEPTNTKIIYYFELSSNDVKLIAKKENVNFASDLSYSFQNIQSIELGDLLLQIREIKSLISKGRILAIKEKNNLLIEKLNENTETKKSIKDNFIAKLFFSIYSVNESNQNQSQILSLENWFDLKDNFFKNRKSMYQKGITDAEVIKQELECINNFTELNPNLKVLKDRYIDYLNLFSKSDKKIQSKTKFNPNHFNQKGFDLYNYLIENYSQIGKRKYINIYHFLKKHTNKSIYTFNFTENKYKDYALTYHTIELKNMTTADYKFENEKSTLNSLEEQFRRQ